MKFSNFRKECTIEDYPLGSGKRGPAIFTHETNKKGERILRTTTGKAKASNYGVKSKMADGDDGKTYIVQFNNYNFINVLQANMKFSEPAIFDTNPEFERYKAELFKD